MESGRMVAIITGGVSGIGLAIARHVASAPGTHVYLLDLNVATGSKTINQLRTKFPESTFSFKVCNVASWESQVAAFDQAYTEHGHIDLVVANAGIDEQESLTRFQGLLIQKPNLNVMDVNISGTIYSVQLGIYYLAKNKPSKRSGISSRGSIIRSIRRRSEGRACEACRRRKIKCDLKSSKPCSACVAASLRCESQETRSLRDPTSNARCLALENQLRQVMARLADTEAQIAHITSVTNIPNLQSSHGHQMNQQSQVKPRADGGFSESPFVPTKARPPGSDQTPSCVLRPSSATEGTNGGTQIHFSDGTSCNRQYFGATSAVVFASAVKEYIQRLGYEIPRASPTWQASLSSSETSSLSRSRSAIINEVVALLPQQTVATQLLSVYKNHVQEFAPMLFWPSILIKARRLYTSLMIVNDPVSFVKDFCVLNAIWSIGAQLSTPSEFSNNNRKETENGLRFFNLARKYHDLMVPKYDIDDATIALLMTVYLHGMALPGPCWTMAGVTSRIIQDIGLHKRAPVHLFTPTECEARNRIFWGAYTVDRTIALMLGRPIALDDSECSVDLPGEAVREDEMLPSTRIFRINIAVISRLHQIISYDATPGRETKDKTVLEAIDDDLSKCWLSYPKQFTDASLPGACEPSCLKSLFILQQARLTLMRHFTDIRLTSDFRRWCFTKSLMVSKTTARILDNFSNYPKLDASIAYRCNDLVCAHTFRALVVLLLGYGPCAHLSDITVEKLDLLPLWRLLHASSGRRTSAQKYLQLLHIISGALGFEFDDDFQIFQARHTQTDRSYPVRSGTIPNDYICDDSSSWNPRDKPWPLSITDPERTQDSSHGIDPEVNMDGQSHLSPDWSKHVAALFPASTPSAGLCVSDGAETQSVNQLFGHSTQTYDSNLNWDLFAKVMNFDSSAIAFDADSSSI